MKAEHPARAARGRRRTRALVPLVCVAVLTGCASIPSSGPVHAGRDLAQEQDPQLPRSLGRDPRPGDTPDAIVRGFLQSGADFLDDHRFAREYLRSDVHNRWNPSRGTTVYDRSQGISVEVVPGSLTPTSAMVTATATEVARIDADGSYRRVASPVAADASQPPAGKTWTYTLSRVDGEWRIATLADGLLLSSSDIETSYRRLNLYFLAPTTNTVVPDPVLLPDVPGLTSKLVTRLLQGPTQSMVGAVKTAFPQGTRLEVASVPVRDGLATVRLDAAALRGGSDARTGMSAQIVWTLRQLPDVSRIRILGGGDDLVTSGVAREQPRASWSTFDPDNLFASASLYAVRDGRAGRLSARAFVPARGPTGVRASVSGGMRKPAVSLDGNRVAVLNGKSTALFVGELTDGTSLTPVTVPPPAGGLLAGPSWDSSGEVWFADRTTNRLLVYVRDAKQTDLVQLPQMPANPVQTVRVSRDGTRVALVAGTGAEARLFLASVVRNPSGNVSAISAVREVLPTLRGVRDVSWQDSGTLVVVGSLAGTPAAALRTDTMGLDVDDTIDELTGIAAVAAAPATSRLPLVASTDAGQMWQWDATQGWQQLGAGRDPSYPG